jgi:anionic cell wall polymer biosynthesis LytR-Cps2A-Psr (LCP) family protein
MDPRLDPLSLLTELGEMSAGNITFSDMPTDGSTINSAGWVFLVNPAQVKAAVAAIIRKRPSPVATAALAPAAPTSSRSTASSHPTTPAQNTGQCID